MKSTKAPPRLTPEQMMVALLDEIAGRLEDQAAKGVLGSRTFTVGTSWVTLETAWQSCTIYNDGTSDIYIHLDDVHTIPWQVGEAPLKANESISMDLKARAYKDRVEQVEGLPEVQPVRQGSPVLSFICQTGTATVRVFKLF